MTNTEIQRKLAAYHAFEARVQAEWEKNGGTIAGARFRVLDRERSR